MSSGKGKKCIFDGMAAARLLYARPLNCAADRRKDLTITNRLLDLIRWYVVGLPQSCHPYHKQVLLLLCSP